MYEGILVQENCDKNFECKMLGLTQTELNTTLILLY